MFGLINNWIEQVIPSVGLSANIYIGIVFFGYL